MTAPLVQRLSLVVDAATGSAEPRMDALATAAREAGSAAQQSAGQVAAAAERVAAAQLRRDAAVDKVVLAERRLQEAQGKYAAGSSQVLAAEQRLEQSRRELHTATRAAETSQEQQTRAVRDSAEANARAATETERARAGAERMSGQLDNLRGVAAGLVGFGIGDWLRDQTTAYLDGARGAQTLATSMNATVAEGGQLSTLFDTLGLDSADLLEIQAEFAQKIGENGRNLEEFGAQLKTNEDGTVNWASTLVDALSNLQRIPDATERNRRGFQLFGEEGYKQLSRLLTSGVSVEDALAAIGTPFTEEDVRTAQEYDSAMFRLSLEGSELGRTLAREVVPAVSGVVGGLNDVVGAASSIPLPVALATTAALVMGRTGFDPLARSTDFLRGRFDAARTAVAAATAQLDADAGRMARAGATIRTGAAGAANAVGGPVGVALIGFGLLTAAAQQTKDSIAASVDTAVQELIEAELRLGAMAMTSREVGRELADSAGAVDGFVVSSSELRTQVGEASGALGFLDTATGGVVTSVLGLVDGMAGGEAAAQGYQRRIDEAREALGEFGGQQAAAQLTTRGLADLIAAGTTEGEEFADAVRVAAEAQADQTRTSDLTTAALDAYRAQTDLAVDATLRFIDARYASEDANFAFLDALDAANSATDDAATSVDEVREAHVALIEAALRAGEASADAAVANARAAGEIVTPLDEARIRADSLIADLQARLNTPGLAAGAREELQGLVDRLTDARDKGDVQALVTLTGVDDAKGGLDDLSADRDSTVNVESRGGPAVSAYLDRLTRDRLAIIRLESRGGPAVVSYVDRITRDRLGIVRLESRGGPAVDAYVDGLAEQRLAIIRVESRNGPAVDEYLDNLAARRTAIIDVQRTGDAGARGPGAPGAFGAGVYGEPGVVVANMTVQVVADGGGRLTQPSLAEAGRQVARQLSAHERTSGASWRTRGLP